MVVVVNREVQRVEWLLLWFKGFYSLYLGFFICYCEYICNKFVFLFQFLYLGFLFSCICEIFDVMIIRKEKKYFCLVIILVEIFLYFVSKYYVFNMINDSVFSFY